MQQATCSHSNPELQSAASDPECLQRKGGTTDSFVTAPSRSMHIGKRQEKIQHALWRELDALQHQVLLKEHEDPTYKPDPDVQHNPLPTMEIARALTEEMIEAEVLRRVDEVIDERLAKVMTAMILRVLIESFQDRSGTLSIMGNIVGSAVATSIERGRLDDLISEHLTRTVDTEDNIHMMTENTLGNRGLSEQSMVPKAQHPKVLGELKTSARMNELVETGNGNNRNSLVAVFPLQK